MSIAPGKCQLCGCDPDTMHGMEDPDTGFVYRLDDNGVSVEVKDGRTKRELTLVVTEDSRRMYFVARGDGERKAGVVAEFEGVGRLLHWLSGVDFNGDGLGVSKR